MGSWVETSTPDDAAEYLQSVDTERGLANMNDILAQPKDVWS
jgi:hypothetical protein